MSHRDGDTEGEFYGILANSFTPEDRAQTPSKSVVVGERVVSEVETRPRLRNRILANAGRVGLGALIVAGGYCLVADQYVDIFGDIGRDKTAAELRADARVDAIDKLKTNNSVDPTTLFRTLYMSSVPVPTRTGDNGILGELNYDWTKYVSAFDDCLKVKPYTEDQTTFTTTRSEDGSRMYLTVDPPDDAVLHFQFTGGEVTEDNPTGFSLIPQDDKTRNEMGYRGCTGFVNPVNGQMNH